VHGRSEQEAKALKAELQARLAECHLKMHPTKTRIVYCKDDKRKGQYPNVKFDFSGTAFGRGRCDACGTMCGSEDSIRQLAPLR